VLTDSLPPDTDGAVSTASFIAGGVLAVGGAVLFFTARRTEVPAQAAIVPTVGPGVGGLTVVGRF
jgi:hypothetical protein